MKKTMRKSALLSSIAMLIVSAIVLTSATYAWFSASKTVSVEGIEGTVEATTGLLIRKGTSGDWKSSISLSDESPDVFVPVSTADGSSWVTGEYKNNALVTTAIKTDTSADAKAAGLLRVDFQIKGAAGAPVSVEPVFTGTSDAALKVARFALLQNNAGFTSGVRCFDKSTTVYQGTSTVTGDAGNATTSGDAYTVAGTSITPTNSAISLTLADAEPVTFTLWVWVEGNDAECIGQDLTSADIKLSLTFTDTTPSA